MILDFDGSKAYIRLAFTSTEYNCSVKLVGKLVLQKSHDGLSWFDHWPSGELGALLRKEEVKNQLIREFSGYCATHTTYRMLKETSPYFPTDSGRYLPNYLVYADSIIIGKDQAWFTSFKALIREFQQHPEHGFQVFEFPMYNNNTYAGSFWPSKVWGIVPPRMVSYLYDSRFIDKNTTYVKTFNRMKSEGALKSYPEGDVAVVEKAVSG